MARTRRIEAVLSLTCDVAEAAKVDNAAALAFFLMDNTKSGSIHGEWRGRISAADQQTLFGRYIGKGRFYIDGERELVEMTVDVCFGTMREVKNSVRWADLPLREKAHDVRQVRRAA